MAKKTVQKGTRNDVNSYDRFSSDDRAKDAKGYGIVDIRPPRKNRKSVTEKKPKR